MEQQTKKQKAELKKVSTKTGGVCLDFGAGESWYDLSEEAQKFVTNLKPNTEVLVSLKGDKEVSFIQPAEQKEMPAKKIAKNERESETIERVSAAKNRATSRMCALNNATGIAVAKGGSALNEAEVLRMAKEFLGFVEEG